MSDGRRASSGRRQVAVLGLAFVLAVPAGALRLACVGNTCDSVRPSVALPASFCSLPPAIRMLVAAGFRDGRSPDVLAVTTARSAVGGGTRMWSSTVEVPWPSLSPDVRVPIVFAGEGVEEDAVVPSGTSLAQIAPTVSAALGFHRPFPHVRSGRPIEGIVVGKRPRLVVEIVLKGVGSAELEAAGDRWSSLRSLVDRGIGTGEGATGSVPLDPAATLTTIGTGGLPSEHGITGSLLRNADGMIVRAWGRDAPVSIISTLPEDLDQGMQQSPLVGLIATDVSDRGVVGGAWYLEHDRDTVLIVKEPARAVRTVERLLASGFGSDRVPDLLAVVLQTSAERSDSAIDAIVRAAETATADSALFVITGTGSAAGSTLPASRIHDGIDATMGGRNLVEAAAPGGLFLDRDVLTSSGLTGQVARDALLDIVDDLGEEVMADAFQGFAVSFGRYC